MICIRRAKKGETNPAGMSMEGYWVYERDGKAILYDNLSFLIEVLKMEKGFLNE